MANFTNDNALPSANSRNNRAPADAYLNLKLVDSEGNEHKIDQGIPLYMAKRLHECVIAAHLENPDKVFKLVGTVNVVVDEEDKPLVNF